MEKTDTPLLVEQLNFYWFKHIQTNSKAALVNKAQKKALMGQKKKLNRILGIVAPESVCIWLDVAKWFSVVPAGSLNHVTADWVGQKVKARHDDAAECNRKSPHWSESAMNLFHFVAFNFPFFFFTNYIN